MGQRQLKKDPFPRSPPSKRFLSSPFPPLFLDLTDRDRLRWKWRLLGEAPLYDVFAISPPPTYFPFFPSCMLWESVSPRETLSAAETTQCGGKIAAAAAVAAAKGASQQTSKEKRLHFLANEAFPFPPSPGERKTKLGWEGGKEMGFP